MNTFGNLGGMLSPVVVAWSLASLGSSELPLYTLAAGYVFSALCWLGIDPSQPLALDGDPGRQGAPSDP